MPLARGTRCCARCSPRCRAARARGWCLPRRRCRCRCSTRAPRPIRRTRCSAPCARRRSSRSTSPPARWCAAGPRVRATLVRLAERRHVLFIVLHHILADGWSMSLVAGELSAFYLAGLRGKPARLPALNWQYADYAAWQHAEERDAETGLRHWLAHLAGAAADVTLAPDRPRPRARDFAGAGVEFAVEDATARALEALARRHGATLFMVMIGGYAQLLAQLAGRSEIVVGTPAANRELLDTEPLIGLFANTLALRFDLAG